MKYRAKCTKCDKLINSVYPTNTNNYVRDAKELYVEVATIEEADLVETINNATIAMQESFCELAKLKLSGPRG